MWLHTLVILVLGGKWVGKTVQDRKLWSILGENQVSVNAWLYF